MAKVLVVDDDVEMRSLLAWKLKRDLGCEVFEVGDGKTAVEQVRELSPDVMILDLLLPVMHGTDVFRNSIKIKPDLDVVVLTGYGNCKIALEMGREGVREFLDKAKDPPMKIVATVARLLAQAARRPRSARRYTSVDLPPNLWMEGESTAIKEFLQSVDAVAHRDDAVVIEGEEGTCKVDVAHYIHKNSSRCAGLFVVMNCRSFPAAHTDYLLNGYVKGYLEFGDEGSDGYFKKAEGGTLVIHRIEELSPEVQPKLFHILKEKVFYCLGDGREHKVNARIMATTDTNLSELVKEGILMEELVQELNLVTIRVPSLRERIRDIPALVEMCLAAANVKHRKEIKSISLRALENLQLRLWPGNLRELCALIDNVVVRSCYPCAILDDILLKLLIQDDAVPKEPTGAHDTSWKNQVESLESKIMQLALHAKDGNLSEAARMIDMPKPTFHRKMQRYGLKTDDFKKSRSKMERDSGGY